MLRELRQGRSVGLLMDQRYDRGEKMPFFGVPGDHHAGAGASGPALIVPLIPAGSSAARARFLITVHRPVEAEPGLDAEAAARA